MPDERMYAPRATIAASQSASHGSTWDADVSGPKGGQKFRAFRLGSAKNLDCHTVPEKFGIPLLDRLAIFPHERDTSNAKIKTLNELERFFQEDGLIAEFRERERSVITLGVC